MDPARTFLDSLEREGSKWRLEPMERALKLFGNPERRLAVIHVGGTNGKGSVSAMLAAGLKAAGLKAGLYTSPHLVRVNERIVVDGVEIPDDVLDRHLDEIMPVAKTVGEELGGLTYFEVLTLAAILHFVRERVDVSVMEVGLGGRYDATNIFEAPLASVITNVGIDHSEVLGDTIDKIAAEKAEIIKRARPVVTAATLSALRVIKERASEAGSYLRHAGGVNVTRRSRSVDGQTLHIKTETTETEIFLPLAGPHQVENAQVAVATAELVARELRVKPAAIIRGFEATRWRGRFEVLGHDPLVIVDGAHNVDAVRVLGETLDELKISEPRLVFGVLADKQYKEMMREIFPLASRILVTRAPSPRAVPAEELKRVAAQMGFETAAIEIPHDCIRAAVAAGKDTPVVICGSLYLAGAAIRAWPVV